MLKRLSMVWAVSLILCLSLVAQQAPPPQPLTLWYDYTVKPGQEAGFMTLVKTVGAPVRDKLMAEGVIQAWGIEVPVLRRPGMSTHTIWLSVNDWAGVEKVQNAMAAQLAKLAAEEAKTRQKTTMQIASETFDDSKTRDWLTRDLIAGYSSKMPKDVLPYTRYFIAKVKQGKGDEYRKAWEKYIKPVLDKLTADGTVLAWGLGVEEVRTDGDFTHFGWVATADMASWDKIRAAFIADRQGRSEEEREAISHTFNHMVDGDASRSFITRSIMFHLPAPK
jgi:hypothetical protein